MKNLLKNNRDANNLTLLVYYWASRIRLFQRRNLNKYYDYFYLIRVICSGIIVSTVHFILIYFYFVLSFIGLI